MCSKGVVKQPEIHKLVHPTGGISSEITRGSVKPKFEWLRLAKEMHGTPLIRDVFSTTGDGWKKILAGDSSDV